MKKRRQWIMDNTTLQSFNNYRVQKYRAVGIKGQTNDEVITRYYTYIIVHTIRKKGQHVDQSFILQKFVHTAVSLFKRFYLVNQYGDGEHQQNALSCIYLSYKINQVPHDSILRGAEYEKNKSSSSFFKKCLHYGQLGYNQKQLHILRGIGFQIGRSPLISSIESLMRFLNQKIQMVDFYNQTLKFVLEIIRRVYIDDRLIFLHEGPKIGLALVLFAIKKMEVLEKLNLTLQDIYGSQLGKVVQVNTIQIEQIESYLQKLQKFDHSGLKSSVQAMIKKLILVKKNEFQLPERTSPRVKPLIYQFGEE